MQANSKHMPIAPASAALILIIMAATAVCGAFTPWAGDDLVYGPGYSQYYGGSLLYFPRWVVRHWWFSNGRMANYLACLLMHFTPRWTVVALNTLAVGAFYALIALWCAAGPKPPSATPAAHSGTTLAQTFVISTVALAYPWWDSSWLVDVSFNYVWSTALALLWLLLFLKDNAPHRPLVTVLLLLLGFVAGSMHEALGAPLLAGIAAWLWFSGGFRSLSRLQKWMLATFALGVAEVLFAPGIWHRFGNADRRPDDPLLPLLLKSDWMVLIMLAVLAICGFVKLPIFSALRSRVAELVRTPWVIWPVAAVGSMCFSAVGGIVGRSGWFATTFSLIALVQWLLPAAKVHRPRAGWLTVLLFAAVTLQVADTARWQVRTGREMHSILSEYAARPDCVVFADYTKINQLPPHLLNKLRLTPDPDNFYELWTIRTILGDSIHPLIILPTDARALIDTNHSCVGCPKPEANAPKAASPEQLLLARPGKCSFGEITTTPPPLLNDSLGIALDPLTGSQMIVQPLPYRHIARTDTLPLYYVTPRLLNPGDR